MDSLRWRMARLQAMPPAEVLFRTARAGAQAVERVRLARGWKPKPSSQVGTRLLLFGESIAGDKLAIPHPDPNALADLLEGRIRVFSQTIWWPREPDWHLDPLSGVRLPLTYGKALDYRDASAINNVKVVWELGRQQHLVPVAVAYALDGEEGLRRYLVAQIESWLDSNPFGFGVHWCSALEVSLRLISYAIVHSLVSLRHRDGLFELITPTGLLEESVHHHMTFVRGFLSRFSSANNHLIGELTGLYCAGTVFELGAFGDECRSLAKAELERQAALQVFSDGGSREQAIYYHLWVLEYLLLAWVIGRRAQDSFSRQFGHRILTMTEFLEALRPRDGQPPQIGDADDGVVARFDLTDNRSPYDEVTEAVAEVFGLAGQRDHASSSKRFWYAAIGRSSSGFDDVSRSRWHPGPDSFPVIFPNSGYVVLSAHRLHVVLDAGQLGYPSIAAHGHADGLSFCLAVDGQWWLVDPGTYAYHTERRWRDYFRGSRAHNTLTFDGQDQSLSGGAFLWVKHAEVKLQSASRDCAGGQHASGSVRSAAGHLHFRELTLDGQASRLLVRDRVEANAGTKVTASFHFHPDVSVRADSVPGQWIATRAGAAMHCVVRTDSALAWRVAGGEQHPILGWYSERLYDKTPCLVLVGSVDKVASASFETEFTIAESD